MPALTLRDRQMMTFLARFHTQHGYAPSLREIGDGVGLGSVNTVWARMKRLEEFGLIEREAGKSRALRIVGDVAAWIPTGEAS